MTPDPREDLVARLSALRLPEISPTAVADLAGQEFSAADADGIATATVSGSGELLRLEVSAVATLNTGRERAGPAVVSAVNAALAEAEAARRALRPDGGDLDEQLDELTTQFNSRMDGLLARLDKIERNLRD
ncbi:MAG: YbaB/EbfC family nucleoid-associated protein [Actinomycetota bacterium]|nr:YbaB/EbfC family nucleoid-associated protein [Actinomycetota bacterium]